MKADRRLFLKALAFAGGGTLGFMSSPAPWHLIRDLARWTQNWPWVPVPLHGKPSRVKSFCGMCNGGCGIDVRKVDERLVRIDGNKSHPMNRGFVCPLGTAGLQMVYGPSRIPYPLKRTGTRQNPKWKIVSWEHATEKVADKIRELRSSGQSHGLVCITNDSDNSVNRLFERFLQSVGSRNFVKMNSGRSARTAMLKLMQGVDGDIAYDFENADLILSFGCALLEGWGTCGRMYSAYERLFSNDGGTEIIQIEPNLSSTASKASRWIPIKPGTDAALALGIVHVLISEGSYDTKFVADHCFGFEDWEAADGAKHTGFKSAVLANYSPPYVERITGVSVKDIENLAHRFAEKKPSLAIGGGGRGEHFAGLYELMAVHSLNALIGNINQKGGVLIKPEVPVTPLPVVVMDEEAKRGYSVKRLDAAGGDVYPFSAHLPGNLDANRIGLLFIHEVNPYYDLPEQETARRIFDKVPFIVSFSSYMDESTSRADLILPLSTRLERWDDLFAAPEMPYAIYNLTRPVVEPLYQTKDAGGILIQLAKKLGGTIAESFPWAGTKDLLKERARGLYEVRTGMIGSPDTIAMIEKGVSEPAGYSSFSAMWEDLLENNCWFDPKRHYGDSKAALKTPAGKFEFYSWQLKEALKLEDDEKCMPHFEEQKTDRKEFNLLVMPEDMLLMADDGKGTPPFLMKQLDDRVLRKKELFVKINPITAMYQNLQDGDRVILETPRGKVEVRLHAFQGVREGVVLIPLGFGHTAYDEYLRDKGVNAHQILEARQDKISGLPVWWATPGRLRKV